MAKKSGPSLSQLWNLAKAGRESEKGRLATLVIQIYVDSEARRDDVLLIKRVFMPSLGTAQLSIRALGAESTVGAGSDLVVVISGRDGAAGLARAREAVLLGVPCALVTHDRAPVSLNGVSEDARRLLGVINAQGDEPLLDGLASFVAGALPGKQLALAANFPFLRPAVGRRLTRSCGTKNATVALVGLGHGADLPIMCANQARLAFDLSAAYAQAPGLETSVLLVCVAGTGLLWRAAARKAGEVLPLPRKVLQPAIAYLGTAATSLALAGWLSLRDGRAGSAVSGL